MAKYLDKEGLETYEATVKGRLKNKQDTLESGTNIKTINNESIIGSGNIDIQGGSEDYTDLTNKPQINGVTLSGNKTTSDLGITIPTKVSDLTNDTGFITNTVNNLTNYYTSSNTYTKTEVDQLIGAISTLDIQIVQTLPATGSTSTIYLVPKTASTNDNYDEYIYVSNSWEHIGSTEVDLSNYYTKTETDNKYALKSLYGNTAINVGRKASTTVGNHSTALGENTEASGYRSYAEGSGTKSTSYDTHAEGTNTEANYQSAHAEGQNTKATGLSTHAEGLGSQASGEAAHAEGYHTKASGDYQHVSGKYNIEDSNGTYAEIIGNGTANNSRSNARTLDWSGNEVLAGSLTINGNQTVTTTGDFKTINSSSILGSGDISVSTFSGSYNDLTNKPIYDASYILVGQTITNEQYNELANACNNKNIINLRGLPVYSSNPQMGNTLILWYIDDYGVIHIISVSKTSNNHTVTEDEELLLNENNIWDYVGPVYANIAQYYDSTSTYNIGDYVLHGEEGETYANLYKCTTAVTTPEDFDSTKWTQVITMDEIKGKQDALVSGTNIKTINNTSILGSGNITAITSETDPVFSASAAAGISSSDISNWNGKLDYEEIANGTTFNIWNETSSWSANTTKLYKFLGNATIKYDGSDSSIGYTISRGFMILAKGNSITEFIILSGTLYAGGFTTATGGDWYDGLSTSDIINNLTTSTSGNGVLDAYQGYVLKGLVDTNSTNIGDLTNLTTTTKTNLVSAVNEVNEKNIMTLRPNGNKSITISSTYGSGSRIPLDTLQASIGNKLTNNSNKIVVGDGVNHIKVSAYSQIKGIANSIELLIRQNGNMVGLVGNTHQNTNQWLAYAMVDIVLSVQEGDSIDLAVRAAATGTIVLGGNDYTHLTVEVID